MFRQFHREVTDPRSLCLNFIDQIKAARQIDDCAAQSLIHRYHTHSVAPDAGLVSKRLLKCLSETDRNVFDRMVIVNLEIAAAFNREIEEPVPSKQIKHVIEKRNSGVDPRCPAAVE